MIPMYGAGSRAPSIPARAGLGLANDPSWRQFAAGPNAYGAAPPDNQRDAFAARDLGMVAAGHDMRFGPMSPQSMFRGPTVRSAPGQYDVHPMMPSRGGPMPMPAPDLGTSQYDRNIGAAQWAALHQSPGDGSTAQMLGMRPGGDLAFRITGFPKAGSGRGPGFAYAPAAKIGAAYNRLSEQNPGLNLGNFNIGDKGIPMDASGKTPVDPASLHDAMIQARRQRGQQNIDSLRDNMRSRLAIRAAQRGNFGPLSNLMRDSAQRANAGGEGIAGNDGAVGHREMFALAGNVMNQLGDKLPAKERLKFMSSLAEAMVLGKGGAAKIPGLIGGLGGVVDDAGGADADHNKLFGLAHDMLQRNGESMPHKERMQLTSELMAAMMKGKAGAADLPGIISRMGDVPQVEGPKNPEAMFGLAGGMLEKFGGDLASEDKLKFLSGLVGAMMQGKEGAKQVPGMITGLGDSVASSADKKRVQERYASKRESNRLNSLDSQLSSDEVAAFRSQFKDPRDFIAWARSQNMNDMATNKHLYSIYGPSTKVSSQDPSGNNRSFFGYETQIDPNQGYQPVPAGIVPGIANQLYNLMPGHQATSQTGSVARMFSEVFGMTAPPPVVGPAPRGGQFGPVAPQQRF